MQGFTRRQALIAGTAAPLAGMIGGMAKGEEGRPAMARTSRFKLGSMEITTLLAGTDVRPDPGKIFGTNVSPEEFKQVSIENFLPVDRARFYYTPTLVRTGEELVLFDTGLDAESMTTALAEAGVRPDEITLIVLTHLHRDHVGGLMTDAGAPTFANARYMTGAIEHNHWQQQDSEVYRAKVAPLLEKIEFLEDGDEVLSGITALAAFGHTPGHMAFHLDSDDQQLTLTGDTTNHYVWSLAYPEWEVAFDFDKVEASKTRQRLLQQIAAERTPMIGYHMPFPALGYVAQREDGYQWVPASYQLSLD
jgi:glyoxylase-like metal-dependent hydrolase (beta-lactamase superfamily II)